MVAHHLRLRRRLPVRRGGPLRQCCVVSVDARPACECDRCNPDLAAGCDEKSICHGRGGAGCCRAAGERFAAVLRRSRYRSASARSCHLASLSEGGGARSESSTRTTPPAERTPLCGSFPGLSFPMGARSASRNSEMGTRDRAADVVSTGNSQPRPRLYLRAQLTW